jgi:hypothetical protein
MGEADTGDGGVAIVVGGVASAVGGVAAGGAGNGG